MMANWTKAERARREAEAKAEPAISVHIPTLQESGSSGVSRGTSEALTTAKPLMDAKEYADKIIAKRKEFSGMEQKLAFDGDRPGWKRRWVNEENVPGRIEEGFRFVLRDEVNMSDSLRYGNEDTGDRVSKHAGRDEYGHPFKSYLMEIPMSIAKLLIKEKSEDKIALSERSIREGVPGGVPLGNNRIGAAAGLPEIKLST